MRDLTLRQRIWRMEEIKERFFRVYRHTVRVNPDGALPAGAFTV